MFKIRLSAGNRRELIASTGERVLDVLTKEGVSLKGATVALTGRMLDTPDLSCTFAELGVSEGDEVILSVVVKADSAL